jgi:hypothetical protein
MAGDVWQWNEMLIAASYRGLRGGPFFFGSYYLLSSNGAGGLTTADGDSFGFRVASVLTPEPSTGVLAIIACGVILWWRKRFK